MQIISTPDFFSVASVMGSLNRFRAHRNTNTQQNTVTQITTIRMQIMAATEHSYTDYNNLNADHGS